MFAAIVAECPYADLREAAEYRMRRMLGKPAFFSVPAAKLAVSSGLVYALWVDGIDFRQVSPLAATAHGEHTGASAAAPQEFRRRVLAWFGEH